MSVDQATDEYMSSAESARAPRGTQWPRNMFPLLGGDVQGSDRRPSLTGQKLASASIGRRSPRWSVILLRLSTESSLLSRSRTIL
jgi:hypothetical protein